LPGASGGGFPSFSGVIHHVPRSRISTFFFRAASCEAATDPPKPLPMMTASKSIPHPLGPDFSPEAAGINRRTPPAASCIHPGTLDRLLQPSHMRRNVP
jgi:hypothetical protein